MTLTEITESVHVDAPPDVVWALVTDVPRHTLLAGPKSVTKSIEFDGPLELGARWVSHEKFGLQKFDAPSEVTLLDEGHDFGWVSYLPMKEEKRGAGGRAYWDYHLEPEDGGTRLGHHMRVEEPGEGARGLKTMYRVLNLPKKQREAIRTSLANIKSAAEAEQQVRSVTPADLRAGPPTPGMDRQEAFATEGMWSGLARTEPGMVSGWHHHGEYETTLYVLSGALKLEFGPDGSQTVEAGPGDFVRVPKRVVHREINPSEEPADLVVVRAGHGGTTFPADGPSPTGQA
ncbi:hypothetical protein GCM10020367_40150 [Streptomyces sannanensis]|uniref:Cupin type-2 domain-containing protein n=1 Tax=Streptomyces sannanensis TaxID=285536 RepID=A0ABP6SF29_9ACTN